MQKDEFEKHHNIYNIKYNSFENVIEENCGDTLVQIVLDVEQVMDYNFQSLTIAPLESFQQL